MVVRVPGPEHNVREGASIDPNGHFLPERAFPSGVTVYRPGLVLEPTSPTNQAGADVWPMAVKAAGSSLLLEQVRQRTEPASRGRLLAIAVEVRTLFVVLHRAQRELQLAVSGLQHLGGELGAEGK
jgi:hypothetical protein